MDIPAIGSARFQACLGFVWLPENDGQPLHITPGDSGGATNFGVTWATYRAWKISKTGKVPTIQDFRNASLEELAQLYLDEFWTPIHGDDIGPGPDLSVFDFGVLSSPKHAVEYLQMAVGADADGVFGSLTLAAVQNADQIQLIESMTTREDSYFASLSTFRIFGRGWDARAARCRVQAMLDVPGLNYA